jgi:hypothetical protein
LAPALGAAALSADSFPSLPALNAFAAELKRQPWHLSVFATEILPLIGIFD